MSDPPIENFSQRLRLALSRADISQVEFARQIGAHQNQVSSWESGRRNPSLRHLAAIGQTLEMDLDWLVLGRGAPPVAHDDLIGKRLRHLGPELIELVELAREGQD
jgi:transcriptional regulator with XRE-family HTH domain